MRSQSWSKCGLVRHSLCSSLSFKVADKLSKLLKSLPGRQVPSLDSFLLFPLHEIPEDILILQDPLFQ